MDRIYRELNVNHTNAPKVHLDAFILKISIYKNEVRVTEKVSDIIENGKKLIENHERLIEKLIEKFVANGDKLTENRKRMLLLMMANPYISKEELSKTIGISVAAISSNISVMRGKYLNRVGPDKGGFWEVINE